jgi:hypothetical protein
MRPTWTQKGVLSCVHPMAQKGDEIARIHGSSEFAVLRASETGGGDYQVIGVAHIFGVDIADMRDFERDENQSGKYCSISRIEIFLKLA